VVGSRGNGQHRRADACPWRNVYRSPTFTWAGPAFGRSPSGSTVSRELRRNGTEPTPRRRGKDAPYAAQKQAELRGRRPKGSKFDHLELATVVQSKLCVRWSLEQISLHLAEEFPERAEMRVCPETIYQALYVQGRRHLRADLHRHLRTRRGPAPERVHGHETGQDPGHDLDQRATG